MKEVKSRGFQLCSAVDYSARYIGQKVQMCYLPVHFFKEPRMMSDENHPMQKTKEHTKISKSKIILILKI